MDQGFRCRRTTHIRRESTIRVTTIPSVGRRGVADPAATILDADLNAQIVVAGDFNAPPDEVPVMAIHGDVENTGNQDLVSRVLVPIEHTIPASARYTLYHQGHGEMLDHYPEPPSLVLYEGWPVPDPSIYALPADVIRRMDRLLAEDDRDGVVETLFRSLEEISDEDMAALRSAPPGPDASPPHTP